jgi:hypothetical protein
MLLKPTIKDLVHFVAEAFEYELLGLPEVVAWGDEVIATSDDPPTWALDLAMAPDLESIGAILRQMEWLPDSSTTLDHSKNRQRESKIPLVADPAV